MIKGLNKQEVSTRLKSGKVNIVPKANENTTLKIIGAHFLDISNIIIFACCALLLVYNQVADALLFSFVILINIAISVFQELKSKESLAKINVVKHNKVLVVRDSKEQEIEPDEIVMDDVVIVMTGNSLYVDGEVIITENLLVDESILTGESDYKSKQPGEKVFSGSFVVAGRAYYKVTTVGMDSFVNKVSVNAQKYVRYVSPLQERVGKLVKVMTGIAFIAVVILVFLNSAVFRLSDVNLLNAVLSIVSSAVPQGILLTLTLAFIVGVIRMYQKRILVQKANSIETLANIKVLCMDKTGTLTQNKLHLENIHFMLDATNAKHFGGKAEELLYTYLHFTQEQNKTVLALKLGLEVRFPKGNKSLELLKAEVIKQVPFTSKSKFSALTLEINGKVYTFFLGAVDVLNTAVVAAKTTEINEVDVTESAQGRRNLLFAVLEGAHQNLPSGNEEKLLPLAVLSLEDKLRLGARDIVTSFTKQGIKPVVISGDGPGTLLALLKQLQLPELDKVITGSQLSAAANENDFKELVLGHDVFARVTPEQKLEIVKVFKQAIGHVAMIGDGVNDALAIKEADLGISLAEGANVSKQIADVVLLDNDLQKLSDVMYEGREILFNTLRSAKLLFVKNIYSVVVVLFALAMLLPFPFEPRGLLLLSFFNGNIPILLILLERSLRLKSLNFMYELTHFLLVAGILSSSLSIVIMLLFKDTPNYPQVQTALLGFLVLASTVNSLFVLNNTSDIIKSLKSWRSLLVLVTNIGGWIIILNFEPLRFFFQVVPLTTNMWVVISSLTVVYWLLLGSLLTLLPTNKRYKAIAEKLLV